MKVTQGQKVKFTDPKSGASEVGTVGHIDSASGLVQLNEWLESGKRTKWEPQDRFEAVK